jgi:hypothetical protein
MSNHITYQPSTSTHGKYLQRMVTSNEDADRYLKEVRDVMVQMFEGDGSQDAHYSTIKTRFGFETDASAHAAFSEIDTAFSKTSGNASVSGVRAARDQLFSKLR